MQVRHEKQFSDSFTHVNCPSALSLTQSVHTLEIMEGKLPRRALNLVLDCAELHRDELLSYWDKCRIHQQPDKIEPLP